MTRLRIGVDVSCLSAPLTGIGRYAFEILKRLTLSQHEWFLYSHKPMPLCEPMLRSNVRQRFGRSPKRLLRMLWIQTFLPLYAQKDHLDVFWSPAHRLPLLLPRNIAKIVTIHDMVWKRVPETMQRANRLMEAIFMPPTLRLADRIIADSKSTENDIAQEMPFTRGRITTIPLGVDATSHPGESHAPLTKSDSYYILFVGTLEKRKNLTRLLEAYAKLPEQTKKKATITIAGGKGWGGVDVKQIVERLNLSGSVRVLGYVEEPQLAALYANALFLAMPSLYEGFGLPLLEAMARGTPVLTSNCSSMPEVAGAAGVFVNPLDVNSIAQGLTEMIENNLLRQSLAAQCRAIARQYTWEKTASETLRVFEEAATNHKR